MIKIEVREFQELTLDELYAILRLRSEVFVVEQNCVYQDLDDKDQKALHVLGLKDNVLIAYTRVFDAGIYFDEASIGRAIVREKARKYGYGYDIMKASIETLESRFNVKTIKSSAQTYLRRFYNTMGFNAIGEEYLEDGIPHIEMRLQL